MINAAEGQPFAPLTGIIQWSEDHLDLDGAGIKDSDLEHLKQAAQAQKLGPRVLETWRQLVNILSGTAHLPPEQAQNLRQLDLLLPASPEPFNKNGIVADLSQVVLTEGEGVSDHAARIFVPHIHDPRALYLSPLGLKNGTTAFVNGYDPKRNTLSLIVPVTDQEGQVSLVVRTQDAETGAVVKVRKLGFKIHAQDNTHSFVVSEANDSPVFVYTSSQEHQQTGQLARYPTYRDAGFQAPLKMSTVFSYRGSGDSGEHYFLDVFVADAKKIELAIIENREGGVEKLADFRLGREYLPQADPRLGTVYKVSNELTLSLKKKVTARGVFYQALIYHNLDDQPPSVRKGKPRLTPIHLNKDNSGWQAVVQRHVERLSRVAQTGFDPQAFLKELYRIKNNEGMRIVHEVIMSLYYREDTQLFAVQALKISRGLPLPADTRIIPASTDDLSFLVDYLTQQNTRGELSKTVLKSAQKHTKIPARFVIGLWLATRHKTLAERGFFRRGAATPEYVIGFQPVQAYRRIVDEDYTVLANTPGSRRGQRERIREMLAHDAPAVSFGHYLGQQLDLASEFDLLILDSGYLYYDDKRVHPLHPTADGRALAVIDNDGDVFEIPKNSPSDETYVRPLALSEENVEQKEELAPTHSADRFRYVWLAGPNPQLQGTFHVGTMLYHDECAGCWRRPTALEVAQSLQGLLPLPQDYLSPQAILPLLPDPITITKGEVIEFDLGKHDRGFEGIRHKNLLMTAYTIKMGGAELKVFLPCPHSQTARVLGKMGFYVPKEDDLPQIARYYAEATRKGFFPDEPNLYLMPGELSDGILGLYSVEDEKVLIFSVRADTFEKWAAEVFFGTVRHEIAHAVHRMNPWITSMLYRCMALDGASLDYGITDIDEYWSVLVQNFFDHPLNRYRFPNGYRLIYSLIKLREVGERWDGPFHEIEDVPEGDEELRNLDGTTGALRALATGGTPFVHRIAGGGGNGFSVQPPGLESENTPHRSDPTHVARAAPSLHHTRRYDGAGASLRQASPSQNFLPAAFRPIAAFNPVLMPRVV